MDEFKENFRSEGQELIGSLEAALLDLEGDFTNKDQISNVFRVMHSLKGGAGMFGFASIEAITHDLETVYDAIRNDKFELSQEIFDTTYKVLDHLRNIIIDDELLESENAENHQKLLVEIKAMNGQSTNDSKSDDLKNVEKKNSAILFRLKVLPELIRNGSNPFFLIEDLAEIGTVKVKPFIKADVTIENVTTESASIYWIGTMKGEFSMDDVDEVFMFVEDEISFEFEKFDKDLEDIVWSDYKDTTSLKAIVESNSPKEEKPIVKKKEGAPVSKTPTKSVESMRVRKDKLDELMGIVSELVTTQASLKLFAEENISPGLEVISESIEKLSRRLRDNAFGLTLTPISSITTRFKRLIRDVASELGKDIDFEVVGEETELDKTLVEKIVDPIMHMLRNSVDHGIESQEDRVASGKDPKGKVRLKAFYTGTSVNIEIKDDGKGIDPDIIFRKACEKGIVKETDQLTKLQKLQLIFYPGFSTAEAVTDLSGRGVGMDVVRKNIEELRGEVLLDSEVGIGSVLTLKLPLTLSIIDGLIVKLENQNFILPISSVSKCHKLQSRKLSNDFNHVIELDDVEIPYVNVRDKFQINTEIDEEIDLIVVENGERLVALAFDKLIGEVQAVIKPLGPYYSEQDYYSGCTILGDGSIAIVLDPNRLIHHFVK